MKCEPGYIMTKLEIMYFASIVKDKHGMLNNVKVGDLIVKTGYSNWKNAR